MHVRRISVDSFTLPTRAVLDLPERGCVVITGANGSGKSSWIEAVSFALYGKLLRGVDPWLPETPGLLSVFSDRVEVVRSVTAKGQKKLVWNLPDLDPVAYDTQTKTQEALSAVVGEFEVWRRTHVFSASDAAHFSEATDADRKALLERLLRLDVFDPALEACRQDRVVQEKNVQRLLSLFERAIVTLDAAQRLVKELAEQPEEPEPEIPPAVQEDDELDAEAFRLSGLIETCDTEIRALDLDLRGVEARLQAAKVNLGVAQKELDRFRDGSCPTCNREMDAGRLSALSGTVIRWREDAAALALELGKAQERVMAEKEEISADRSVLVGKLAEVRASRSRAVEARNQRNAAILRHTDWNRRQAARAARLAAARNEAGVAETWVEQARVEHDTAVALLAETRACEVVLGVRGVRAMVLGKALAGVEAVANSWLARLSRPDQPIVVRLQPYSEKKTGGVDDRIALKVEGVAAGKGYRAASQGQRRRIDVALLLAFAEVSSEAAGALPGTVWMDEVLDALDEDGVDSVVRLVEELARQRAVVVVTHSMELARRIPAVLRVRMDGGKVV